MQGQSLEEGHYVGVSKNCCHCPCAPWNVDLEAADSQVGWTNMKCFYSVCKDQWYCKYLWNYETERVNSTKLLGLYLDSNLTWHTHIDTMLSKSTQRLYFLKQLSRASVPQTQLRHFYLTVIRPVLEYAAPVRHHLITKTQADQIAAIQKRAIRIIYTCTHDMPYLSATFIADLPTMSDRRDQLSRKFFNYSTLQPTSPLHSLLPPLETNYPSLAYELPQNSPVSPPEQKSISPFSRMP